MYTAASLLCEFVHVSCSLMGLRRVAKAFISVLACIRLHSYVSSFMFLAISKLTKALFTILAMLIRSCLLQADDSVKHSASEYLHVYVFSPVWVCSCCLQSDDRLKHLSQCLHEYGFTPVWVRSCFLQSDKSMKHLLQCLHVYGFSPVWVRSCRLQFPSWLKDLSQCLQVYGFISVRVRSRFL